MSFLTPGVFDALVIIVVIVGLIAAAIRISQDFRQGPRWPEKPLSGESVAPKQTDPEGDEHHA